MGKVGNKEEGALEKKFLTPERSRVAGQSPSGGKDLFLKGGFN